MAAGDFSSSELVEIKLKVDEIYSGETAEAAHYRAETEALKAILENQTGKVVPLSGYQEKDNTVGIQWIDATGVSDGADADNCTVTEAELETKAQPVTLSLARKAGFSVSEAKLRTSIFSKEEVIAKGMLAAMKELDEWLAVQALLFLNASSGTPVAGSFGAYTFNATAKAISVPAADYKSELIPFMMKMGVMNKIRDSFVIDSGDLFIPFQNAKFNSGNGEGKGDQNRFNAMPMYFDMFNFAASGITPDTTYQVGKSAVAFAHKVRYKSTPEDWPNDQKRYSIKSKNLPGVEYEVIYQLTCSGDEKLHSWRLRTKAGLYLNPTAVATNTGVIALAKV